MTTPGIELIWDDERKVFTTLGSVGGVMDKLEYDAMAEGVRVAIRLFNEWGDQLANFENAVEAGERSRARYALNQLGKIANDQLQMVAVLQNVLEMASVPKSGASPLAEFKFYGLDSKHQVIEVHRDTWAALLEDIDRRRVAMTGMTTKDGVLVEVSTVFLGLDHNFNPDGPPLLFETMIFPGNACWRWATWDEAQKGHCDLVALISEKIASGAGIPDLPSD